MIYEPLSDRLWHASKGNGAFLNDRSIAVSQTAELCKSHLSTGFAYKRGPSFDASIVQFAKILNILFFKPNCNRGYYSEACLFG